jgi:hypothetical protein
MPAEVDHSKDKKGFNTEIRKPERKAIVSCYENSNGMEDHQDPKQSNDQDLKT